MSLTQKLWVLRLPKPHSPYLRKTNWTLDLYLIRYTLKTLRISIAISHFFGRAKAVGGLLSTTIFQQGKKNFFFLSLFLPFFCHSYPKRKNNGKNGIKWANKMWCETLILASATFLSFMWKTAKALILIGVKFTFWGWKSMYFRNSALIGENRGVPNTTHARMSACLIHFWGARRAPYPNLYNPNMFMLAPYSNYDAREHKNSRHQTKIRLN